MKAQEHACCHVNIPFSAYFYPPLHHSGKGSINPQTALHLDDLEEAPPSLLRGVGERLLLQVVGVHLGEGHAHYLIHYLRDHFRSFLATHELQPWGRDMFTYVSLEDMFAIRS